MAREPNSYYNNVWKVDEDAHHDQGKCIHYDPFHIRLVVDTAEYGMKKMVYHKRITKLKGLCSQIQDFHIMSKGVKYSNEQRTKD